MDMIEVINYITLNEGFRSKPYHDTSGKLTIGFGRNLDDVPLSKEIACQMLREDIKRVVDQLLDLPEYRELSDKRKIALIDMAYNLGFTGLMDFKKMWEAIKDKNFMAAANEIMRSEYAKQVGQRANRNYKMMRGGK